MEQKNFVLVLQPKRISICNKEKYIWLKCLLIYFKDPLLKSKDSHVWLTYDFLNWKYIFSYAVKLIQIFSQHAFPPVLFAQVSEDAGI